jgi:uncharacterized membrane protein (DUF485 family)
VDDRRIASIKRDPTFVRLVSMRRRFRWALTAIMLLAYFGFVLATAFGHAPVSGAIPKHLASRLLLPIALIVLPVLLTGLYVLRANLQFDGLTDTIVKDLE